MKDKIIPVDEHGNLKKEFNRPLPESSVDFPLRVKKENSNFLLIENKTKLANTIDVNRLYKIFFKYIETSLLLHGKPLLDYVCSIDSAEELGEKIYYDWTGKLLKLY